MNNSATEPPLTPDVTESQWDTIEKGDALEYDAETETYRASFDKNTESVCTAVISAVAVVSDTSPIELPPLNSVIDPDALETLVESATAEPLDTNARISITFNGCNVTIDTDGIIAVQPQPETSIG